MRGPQRFDPHEFGARARDVYEDFGIDPDYGHMAIGNKKIPAMHHEYSHNAGDVSVVTFRIPTEFGTTINTSIADLPGIGRDISMVSPGTPITGHTGESTPISTWRIPYEGPEHLNEMIQKHHRALGELIMSKQFSVNPRDRGWHEEILRKHHDPDYTDPEYPIRTFYVAPGGLTKRGKISPRHGFRYREDT